MMRLVASTPNSKPLPEPTRGILASVSQDFLREVVARISVPRVQGSSENEAVRRLIELGLKAAQVESRAKQIKAVAPE